MGSVVNKVIDRLIVISLKAVTVSTVVALTPFLFTIGCVGTAAIHTCNACDKIKETIGIRQ